MIPFADLRRIGRLDRRTMYQAVREVAKSGYFVGGPVVERFEADFAAYLGVKHVIGVGNGLDALRLTLQAWGIGEGDEVIVPGFTYFATWLAVYQTGATLVPVDVRIQDATIDPKGIEEAISPRTRAIVPVHLYGNTCDMSKIRDIATQRGLKVLEDAAQAHGALWRDKRVGSIGDAGAFSFYPTKNLGAMGDGGAVATDSDELAETVRSMRSYGTGKDKYHFELIGANSRLDPIQAAYLRRRLPHLDSDNIQRQKTAKSYRLAIGSRGPRVLGPKDETQSAWHVFSVIADHRTNLANYFQQLDVATDSHYPYCIAHIHVFGSKRKMSSAKFWLNSNSMKLARGVVSIPLGRWVSRKDYRTILRALEGLGAL